MTLDPYQTLGVPPGASAAEIKRAYRRLVKDHHPDSGGPAALPRFLAIQAAYEILTSGQAPGPGFSRGAGSGGPGGGPRAGAAGATGPRPAWRADPARARATREAGRRGAESGPGPASGPGGGGERPREGTRHPRGTRRKATPGSTTYDEAHHEPGEPGQPGEPGEPGWTGSSWYGQTSGTYWTINPREYADPRKHGPEYLARARKAAQAGGAASDDGDPAGAWGRGDPGGAPEPPTAAGGRWAPGADGPGGPGDGPRGDRSSSGSGRTSRARERAIHGPGARTPGDRRPTGPPQPGPRPAGPAAGAVPSGDGDVAFASPVDLAGVVDGILRAPARPRVRLVVALAAWPPLGIGALLMLGELSGCARFAASCGDRSSLAMGVAAQVVILLLLVGIPPLARLAAIGSLATVVAALPAMAFLTAIGAPYSPQGGPASLLAVMAVAWLAGVILAWRFRPAGRGRGEGSLHGPRRNAQDDGSRVSASADRPSRTMGP